ncbi:hypothetical protein [Nonomuraea sp. B19D2]|uniref:hypothetical protein n=1 Tax=Nonomuraea sp. B19D2 TaxID=3159561 RepID=UPI0032DA1314
MFYLWFENDVRNRGRPLPHSHPWSFTAFPLANGDEEHRYHRSADGTIDLEVLDHQIGGGNHLPRETHHEVTALHGVPGTLTALMAETAADGLYAVGSGCTRWRVSARARPGSRTS